MYESSDLEDSGETPVTRGRTKDFLNMSKDVRGMAIRDSRDTPDTLTAQPKERRRDFQKPQNVATPPTEITRGLPDSRDVAEKKEALNLVQRGRAWRQDPEKEQPRALGERLPRQRAWRQEPQTTSDERPKALPRDHAWRHDPRRPPAPSEDGLPYFLQGYEPVGIHETCEADPIGPDQLAVWVNRTGEWEQLDVDDLWGRNRKTESLCRHLVTNLLGMTAAQYESMKDAFDEPDASERIGIYRMEEDDVMNYAIVVRMVPRDYKSLLKAGVAGATAALGGGALAYYLAQKRKKPDSEAPKDPAIPETYIDQTWWLGRKELELRQLHKAITGIRSGIQTLRGAAPW